MDFPEFIQSVGYGTTGAVTHKYPKLGKFDVEWFDERQSTERISFEGDVWVRLIDRKTAEAALAVVQNWMPPGYDPVRLYEPGFHADGWVIAMDGGPEDWPIHLSDSGSVKWPAGVGVEALNHWSLSLYTER